MSTQRLVPIGERGRPPLVGPAVTRRANGDLFLNQSAWTLLGGPKTVKLGVSHTRGALEISVTHRGDREGFRVSTKGGGFLIRSGRAMEAAGLLPERRIRMEARLGEGGWPTLVVDLKGRAA